VNARDMLTALFPILTLVGLFVLAAIWISRRARMRELAHRERLAMIEKGLLPPAELFGGGSDLALPGALDAGGPPVSRTASRFRSAGVMFVGIGVAVGLIIGVAALEPTVGLGVGGAIAAIGAAMIVNGVLGERELTTTYTARPAAPGHRPGPDMRE
jgi:hypothetical protein